ncbi:MAG: hypothetical protein AB1553_11925 [Nitrospirota bacterium]
MPEQSTIADEILGYLSRQPEGEATLESIMNWWVRADKGSHSIKDIGDALKTLVERGELEEIKDKQPAVMYRIRRRKEA